MRQSVPVSRFHGGQPIESARQANTIVSFIKLSIEQRLHETVPRVHSSVSRMSGPIGSLSRSPTDTTAQFSATNGRVDPSTCQRVICRVESGVNLRECDGVRYFFPMPSIRPAARA